MENQLTSSVWETKQQTRYSEIHSFRVCLILVIWKLFFFFEKCVCYIFLCFFIIKEYINQICFPYFLYFSKQKTIVKIVTNQMGLFLSFFMTLIYFIYYVVIFYSIMIQSCVLHMPLRPFSMLLFSENKKQFSKTVTKQTLNLVFNSPTFF